MYVHTVYFALLPVSCTCTNSRDYVANEVQYLDCTSFPNTCRISISMTIAYDLSASSKHILLIAFVINPVLISWLELQQGFLMANLLHSKEFEFRYIHNALYTLLFTFLHLATVGLRHSGHLFPFWLIYYVSS